MIFVGIDPGLTAPAVCVMDERGEVRTLRTIRTGRATGDERVSIILRGIQEDLMGQGPFMASIEDYAYSRNAQGQRAGIECVGVIKRLIYTMAQPYIQQIGPVQLRKYLTGQGAHAGKGATAKERREANKRAMIDAAAHAGVQVIDDNQADAWGLATILRDAYLLATRGVRPATLYRYEVCAGLVPWINEQIKKGA